MKKRGRDEPRRQWRDPLPDEIWLTGRHLVRETLAAGRWPLMRVVLEAGISDSEEVSELERLAHERGVPVETGSREAMDARAGPGRHQGVAAQAGPFPFADLELEIVRAREAGKEPLILCLDQLNDPHNTGAILRSAEAAGVTCAVLTERRQVGVTAVVARTSAGAVGWLPIAQVTNLAQTLDMLSKDDFWIYGASEKGARTIYEADLRGAVVMVVGGEGEGLRQLSQKRCDELLRIPMAGNVSSLNASVAAGVMLFESVRQRSPKPPGRPRKDAQ